MDFVQIRNVYIGKMIIKAAKRIVNSDKICRSYSDLNVGVTFFWNTVYIKITNSYSLHSRRLSTVQRIVNAGLLRD